ncbi:MAG: hypothetical protein JO096_11370, partial [Alphaproteobacteria bacterium]|nr:hypothetical protein [Alphaproteobacteria bacterium]
GNPAFPRSYIWLRFKTTFLDPVTINIDVGWGEIDGSPLNPGNLGQSRTNQPGNFTYS